MIKAIGDVFDLAYEITGKAKHVKINEERLKAVSQEMRKTPLVEKQVDEKPYKGRIPGLDSNEARDMILKELVADSVNYCYWIYDSDIRPNGAGSNKMRELLDESFDPFLARVSDTDFELQIRNFQNAMMLNRFPLMDKRAQHLKALCRSPITQPATGRYAYRASMNVARTLVELICMGDINFEFLFNCLIKEIDGFGDDPFLKRASLFFLQLNRILGLFENEVQYFPLPADYQVPKLMRYHGILQYGILDHMIQHGMHLRENEPLDMEIRAATIIAGRNLCTLTEWPASDVDGWFFIRRKECKDPFHLCITSNY